MILQEKIQCRFPTMRVFKPNEPGSAVIKGAVEFGHCPDKLRFRMAPHTYGINQYVSFCYGKHPVSKLRKINGEAYCEDIFDIHVKINQLVETGTEISNKTYEPLNPDQKGILFQVVTSESTNPEFVDDPGNRIIGSFHVRIPDAYSSLQRSVNVRMIFSGTELEVEARNAHTKQIYKTTFRFE